MKSSRSAVIYPVLFGIVCLFMGGAMYGVYRLGQSPLLIPTGPLAQGLWGVTQAETEVVNLLHQLAQFESGTASVSADDISLQFDIVWSRYGILKGGDVYRRIVQGSNSTAIIEAMQNTLAAADPLMARIQAGDRAAADGMHRLFAPLQPLLHELSVEFVHLHTGAIAKARTQTQEIIVNTMLFLVITLLSGGVITGLLIWQVRTVIRETSERRAAEKRTIELVLANEELIETTRAKDQFLAAMSHELRTPLNAVIGLSEILQEDADDLPAEQRRQYLHTIHESGQHLLALINDILDIARARTGEFQLNFSAVKVDPLCQASLRLIRQALRQKHLHLSTSIDTAVDVVRADERRLKQILVNLLSNAVKFTPSGGEIGLEVSAENHNVRFVVWDTGIGIAGDVMEHIFKPFVQIDNRLAREYDGSGLGLSLVYHMVELHGGSVAVESTPGQGSRFTVRLPDSVAVGDDTTIPVTGTDKESTDKKSAGAMRETMAPAGGSMPLTLKSDVPAEGGMILLAEDNASNIVTLSAYLQTGGYRLVVARDGSEAIQRARELNPDLILMDIQMPGMNGLEAIRRLRHDNALATIPIIALTALAMPEDRQRCMEAGVSEYLSKPVSRKQLLEAIGKCLSPKRI